MIMSELILKIQKDIIRNKKGCFLWQKGKDKDRYPLLRIGNKAYRLHRYLMNMLREIPLTNREWVCHTCDTPSCLNLNHLFIGSPKNNRDDCVNKERHNCNKGSRHHSAKLVEKDILLIREAIKRKECTQRALAKRYFVSFQTINNIIKRKTWRHV